MIFRVVGSSINDKSPSLKFQWLNRDNGVWTEDSGDLRSRWSPSKGNSGWEIVLTNQIADLHATITPPPASVPTPQPTSLQLALQQTFVQDTIVSFQLALYDDLGKMIDLKSADAIIKAGETYISPAIQMMLDNAASLKLIAIDGTGGINFAPIIAAWLLQF